ncbi:MAG TPA: hypothetical protein VGZ93_11645 [Candidatus Methylacidiphilales bacterium]|nr:hypothetical protein [Candidatus Methylacidiphilales bacterium]
MNNSFLNITQIIVPSRAILKMHGFLAEAGRAGLEGFTAWAGVQNGTRFDVKETVIPRQTGHRGQGLYVLIDADELFFMNRWLYENQLTLIAQIHSHPTDAYHSQLDDEIPIATTQGCVSIVVPDFAQSPFELSKCAVFRLSTENTWDEVPATGVLDLIQIIP